MTNYRRAQFSALLALFVCAALNAADDKEKPKIPKGSAEVVAAVQKGFPKAEIDEATEPKGFGSSGGKGTPLFWTVRYHIGETKNALSVTPDIRV